MSRRNYDDPRRGYQSFVRIQDRIEEFQSETLLGAMVFCAIIIGVVAWAW